MPIRIYAGVGDRPCFLTFMFTAMIPIACILTPVLIFSVYLYVYYFGITIIFWRLPIK